MIGLKVRLIFHWGFWVRAPYTSRYQSSLSIPPPTTLIGALVNPLISLGYVKLDGEVVLLNDKQIVKKKGKSKGSLNVIASPVAKFKDMIPTASFYYYNSSAFSYSDINRYITLLYHERIKGTKEEKTVGGRRYLQKFRFGAIKVGKVTAPSSKGVACYLIDEDYAEKILGSDWKHLIQIAAYNINRIGSKESIVSIDSVSIIEDVKMINAPSNIRTRCYIPLRCIDETQLKGTYYIETFWDGGWSRYEEAEYEDYIIPGNRSPISTKPIEVTLKKGKAFELDKEEVLVIDA
jgi:CRISPR-associated protein Cas5 subtype I-A